MHRWCALRSGCSWLSDLFPSSVSRLNFLCSRCLLLLCRALSLARALCVPLSLALLSFFRCFFFLSFSAVSLSVFPSFNVRLLSDHALVRLDARLFKREGFSHVRRLLLLAGTEHGNSRDDPVPAVSDGDPLLPCAQESERFGQRACACCVSHARGAFIVCCSLRWSRGVLLSWCCARLIWVSSGHALIASWCLILLFGCGPWGRGV